MMPSCISPIEKYVTWLNVHKLLRQSEEIKLLYLGPSKKLTYEIRFKIQDNNTNSVTAPENKDYAKFLWLLIDKQLTWKLHIDYVASKMREIISPIARLQHYIPFNTLLEI